MTTTTTSSKQLRPYQKTAVDAVLSGLEQDGRGKLIMACGTGKTFVSQRVAEQISINTPTGATVVVFVPTIGLLQQTLNVWERDRTLPFTFLAVCSDETVTGPEDIRVADLNFPATTDPAVIASFLQQPATGMRLVLSTYHSAAQVEEAAKQASASFDLAIADEAHHIAGAKGKASGVVLNSGFPAKRRLFMTATPRVLTTSAKTKAKRAGFEVVSMDSPTLFGPLLFSYSFADAIADDYLSDFRVLVALTSDREATKQLDTTTTGTCDAADKQAAARETAAALVVLKAAKEQGLTRMISYHSRIRRAAEFVKTLDTITDAQLSGLPATVSATSVDGTMTAAVRAERTATLEHPTSELALIANARCLSEGIDIPALDGVAFVDRRDSHVDIVQAVGRAIRKSPTKSLGYIVIPVIMSEAEVEAGTFQHTEHHTLKQVLFALRAHDDRFAVEVDDVICGTNSSTPDLSSGRVVVTFEDQRLQQFAGALTTRVLELGSPNSEWARNFAATQTFATEHGHARIPQRHTVTVDGETLNLGKWVQRQRVEKKMLDNGKPTSITTDRIARLETLPGWEWDPLGATWNRNFAAVETFAAEHGHAIVPRSYTVTVDGETLNLGKWANGQRKAKKLFDNGKPTPITTDRIARLETLPGWEWDPLGATWNRYFAAVETFAAEHGHARVTKGHTVTVDGETLNLGKWVQRHRVEKKMFDNGKPTPITADRIARLATIPGWIWDGHEASWNRHFAAVETFAAEHGHARIPYRHTVTVDDETLNLGTWVNTQRVAKKLFDNGKPTPITTERVDRLNTIPGWEWAALPGVT